MKAIRGLMSGVVLAAACTVHAAPALVTSPGALGANDSVDWSQLGPDGSTIANAFAATSANARSVSGSLGGVDGCVAVVGGSTCGWVAGTGFNAGDSLIWAEDDVSFPGSGPLSFSFSAVLGAGLYIQANALGAFTAVIEAFNGASSLGSFSEDSANGDGIFVGVLDGLADITGITVSLSACGNGSVDCDLNDFAVNSLLLNEGRRATVPVAPTLPLLALGLSGLALTRRVRSSRR